MSDKISMGLLSPGIQVCEGQSIYLNTSPADHILSIKSNVSKLLKKIHRMKNTKKTRSLTKEQISMYKSNKKEKK